MSERRALLERPTAPIASYPTELLIQTEGHVHGLVRRASAFNTDRIDRDPHVPSARMDQHCGDASDGRGRRHSLEAVGPHAGVDHSASSHVAVAVHQPENLPADVAAKVTPTADDPQARPARAAS